MLRNKIILVILGFSLIMGSCMPEKKKETNLPDLYDGFHGEKGFIIMNLPPVFFSMIRAENDSIDYVCKQAFQSIDLIRLLLFDENEETIKQTELLAELESRIKKSDFKVLSKIVSEKESMMLYAQSQKDNVVNEVVVIMHDEENLICLDFIGEIDILEMMEHADKINLKQFLNISGN